MQDETRCKYKQQIQTASGSVEIPNCIKGHGPSLPVCIPNPVLAMFHYFNYYRLTQRWTRPRTLPDNQRWVEGGGGGGGQKMEVEGKDGKHYSVCRLEPKKKKAGMEMKG